MAVPNVLRKVKIDGKWIMLPLARIGGRIDWSRVMHHGKPVVAADGTFYLEYFDPKKKRRAVGRHPRDAKAALASQTSVLELRRRGVETEDAPEIQARRPVEGKRIGDVVNGFVASPPLKLRPRSIAKYVDALRAFSLWTKKTHISQLGREDIDGFMAYLVRGAGLEMSTAVDKAVIVLSTMRAHGALIQMKKGDWPQVTEKQPEVYTPETLGSLFGAMDQLERALFQTFLMSGFREQEVSFLAWTDFNPRASTLTVSKKPELGFDPKNYQERTIPVPQQLVQVLLAHRATQHPPEHLVFPTTRQNHRRGTPGGQRDRHMLAWLKRIAQKAELNCGRCMSTWRNKPTTCAQHPVCANFTLHMFRHTYATTLLHDGVDVVSLQRLMGHKDINSTMKYLRMRVPADLLAKVNASSLATRYL